MKKIFLILMIIAGFFKISISQDDIADFDTPENDASVNFSTGAPTIDIPLINASSGSLSVSTGLFYSSNGIRVLEEEGIVGMSWQLYGGGSIIQEVKGANDFKTGNGYYFNSIKSSYSTNEKHFVFFNYLDAEPDIYNINTPYISGKFACFQHPTDATKNKFVSLTNNNYKIEFTGLFTNIKYFYNGTFKITDDNGVKYYFDKVVKYISYPCDISITQSNSFEWLLTMIESANSVDTITFNYTEPETGTFHIDKYYPKYQYVMKRAQFGTNEETYIQDYFPSNIIEDSTTTDGYSIMPVINLESIVTKKSIIQYNYSETSELCSNICSELSDLITPVNYSANIKLLKSIFYFSDDSGLLNRFSLIYSNKNNRYFLTQLNIENSMGEIMLPYIFTYNQPEKLNKIIDNQDIWGYYSENTTRLYYNRLPDIVNVASGMLTVVKYPTGTYTTYDYEPNRYNINCTGWTNNEWQAKMVELYGSSLDQKNIIGPGVRVKKTITTDGSESFTTEYGYKSFEDNLSTESSGRLINYPVFEYNIDEYWYPFNNTILKKGTAEFLNTNALNYQSSYVLYEEIRVFNGGKQIISGEEAGINGSIKYTFKVVPPEPIFYNDAGTLPFDINYSQIDQGLLLETEVFNSTNIIKSTTRNIYNSSVNVTDTVFIGKKILAYHYCSPFTDFQGWTPCSDDRFIVSTYTIPQEFINLTSERTTTYDDSGNHTSNEINYEYNNIHGYLSKSYYTTSTGDTYSTYYYYPGDAGYTDGRYKTMVDRNIKAVTLKTETKLKKAGTTTEKLISDKETFFKVINDDEIVPYYIKVYDGSQRKEIEFYDEYDEDLNLLQSHTFDNVYSSTIYGYDNTLPIASVTNAKCKEIYFNNFENDLIDFYSNNPYLSEFTTAKSKTGKKSLKLIGGNWISKKKLSSELENDKKYIVGVWVFSNQIDITALKVQSGSSVLATAKTTKTGVWEYLEIEFTNTNYSEITFYASAGSNDLYIDDLKFYPADAYMTTTTYKPLVGVTSVTDANSSITYYEYDAWGRKTEVRDRKDNLLSAIEYNDFLLEPVDFTINGATTINAGSEYQPSITINDPGSVENPNEIIWEWLYTDQLNNEVIVTGLSPIFEFCDTTTFYVTPWYNGYAFDSKVLTVNTIHELSLDENTFNFYNDGDQPDDQIINVNYIGCQGNWSIEYVSGYENMVSWSDFTNSTFTLSCDENTSNISQTTELKIYNQFKEYSFTVINHPFQTPPLSLIADSYLIGSQITFFVEVSGGTGNYTYEWYKSNFNGQSILQANETSNTFTMSFIDTNYPVTCKVLDGETYILKTWETWAD